MFVESTGSFCDFTNQNYSTPVRGAAAVARSAVGRYYEVMFACQDYLDANGILPITYEEAVRVIEERQDGYVDF